MTFDGVLVLFRVLGETLFCYIAERLSKRVERFDFSGENAALEVFNLFARVDFAEVAKVMETDEFLGSGSH